MRKKRLYLREWLVVTLIGGFLTSLVITSIWMPCKYKQRLKKVSYKSEIRKINVEIRGAVEQPGIYAIVPGITVKEACLMAILKKNADRSKVNFKRKILNPCVIDVPLKAKEKKSSRKSAKKD